jgi:hypothetical protein
MRPRRVALLLVTVLATATGGIGATAARATSPSSAASSPKICVALVVDGRSLGSNVSTSCAKVSKGSTGVDVLQTAGHRVTFRNDGLLCTIDGLPKSGCSAVDDSHYWAYFHRAPGSSSWVYSSEGSSTYQPANDATEGWVYDDGTSLKPDNVPYSKICTPDPKPTPSPTATHHRSPKPTPSATAQAPTNRRHHSAPATSPSSSATPSLASHDPPSRNRPGKERHHGNLGDTTDTETVITHTPSPSAAALVGGNPPPSPGNHNVLAIVIGIVVVVALGGLAALRFRRSE